MMQSPQMQQLRQRVIASYHLGPLDKAETQAYIEHRLHHVGWNDDPRFEPACFDLIHTLTGGIPRRINTLCNACCSPASWARSTCSTPPTCRRSRARSARSSVRTRRSRAGRRTRRAAAPRLRRARCRRGWIAGDAARCSFASIEERIERLEKTRRLRPSTCCTCCCIRDARREAGRAGADADGRDRCGRRGPLACVVGARPNYMKMAPLLRAFARARRACPASVLVHTGQHYDVAMNERLFADLELPAPDLNLEVGSGTHAVQTAEVMRRFEPVLDELAPSCVVVVGDVNSTLACSLVASKKRMPVVHVEAGLRSFDRDDAGRDQPRPDRPDRRPAVHDRARRRRQPRARRHRRRARRTSSAT